MVNICLAERKILKFWSNFHAKRGQKVPFLIGDNINHLDIFILKLEDLKFFYKKNVCSFAICNLNYVNACAAFVNQVKLFK